MPGPKVRLPKPPRNNVGFGASNERLPSRHALARLTGGDPSQRTLNMYAKLTPSGAGAPGRYADIEAMGLKGTKIE